LLALQAAQTTDVDGAMIWVVGPWGLDWKNCLRPATVSPGAARNQPRLAISWLHENGRVTGVMRPDLAGAA